MTVEAQEVIYVTADRIKSSVDNSPSDIEVFEQQDIANSSSLTELLKRSSDISIAHSGPIGGNSSLFLRGSDSSHVLVVLDGIILNDPSNPNRQYDFSRLSLNNIERIEILKGSQGLLYGSNAIGGVIILTSKKADKHPTFSANLSLGSKQTFNSSFDVQKKWKETGFSLGVEHLKSDGFSAANDNQVKADRDGLKRTSFNLNLDQKLTAENYLSLYYKQINDENGLDKSGGPGGDDPNDYQKNNQKYLKAEVNQLWAAGETKLNVSQSDIKRSLIVQPDVIHPQVSKTITRGTLETISINHTHELTDTLTFNSNADFQHESDQLDNTNNNLSFFNYARLEKGRHVLNLGGRLDQNKYFKDYFTYKMAYMFSFEETSFKASQSSGFRAPSLNQLFDPIYGNKSLSPEKSRSSEIGINHKFSKSLNAEAVLFRTDIRNRLSYDPGTFVNKNYGRAKIYGVENNVNLSLNSSFSTELSATWLKATDLQTNLNLPRRPKLNSRIALNYISDRRSLSLDVQHTGTRADVDNLGNPVQMKSYTIFNLHQSIKWSDQYSGYVKINNIFNDKYEEVFGYGTGGRIFTLGLRYTY